MSFGNDLHLFFFQYILIHGFTVLFYERPIKRDETEIFTCAYECRLIACGYQCLCRCSFISFPNSRCVHETYRSTQFKSHFILYFLIDFITIRLTFSIGGVAPCWPVGSMHKTRICFTRRNRTLTPGCSKRNLNWTTSYCFGWLSCSLKMAFKKLKNSWRPPDTTASSHVHCHRSRPTPTYKHRILQTHVHTHIYRVPSNG